MRRPMRTTVGAIVALIGLAGAAGGMLLSLGGQDRFPHERHAGLFPTCAGCHAGIAAGDTATFVSITPEDCGGTMRARNSVLIRFISC